MGWCQEFGLRIDDGCDHAMAAGHDSCSCSACGAVCRGRFSGCELVWAAAPAPAANGNPLLALKAGPVAGNGHSRVRAELAPASPLPVPEATPLPGPDVEALAKVVADLTAEVGRLTIQVTGLAEAAAAASPEAVLRGVDARFDWLTTQLSERLVILGNEVMAVKRQVGDRVDNPSR